MRSSDWHVEHFLEEIAFPCFLLARLKCEYVNKIGQICSPLDLRPLLCMYFSAHIPIASVAPPLADLDCGTTSPQKDDSTQESEKQDILMSAHVVPSSQPPFSLYRPHALVST